MPRFTYSRRRNAKCKRREDETINDDEQGEEVDKRAMAWHDELPKTEIKLRPKCCIPGS
jgi:hypothetical protein